jgi:ferritin-like metal-binding protein YciE
MVKTYEDTLISHLTNVYSSKRIGAVLPRLPTATYRHRLPITKNNNQNHRNNIQQAQNLIDNILNNNSKKEEMLYDYIRWQQQWTKNS